MMIDCCDSTEEANLLPIYGKVDDRLRLNAFTFYFFFFFHFIDHLYKLSFFQCNGSSPMLVFCEVLTVLIIVSYWIVKYVQHTSVNSKVLLAETCLARLSLFIVLVSYLALRRKKKKFHAFTRQLQILLR